MKKVRKISMFLIAVVLLFTGISVFSACNLNRTINYGYFRVRFVQSIGMADIIAFTELGRQQEILIVPSVVDGWPVSTIGEWQVGFPTQFRSENLRKLYIPHQVLIAQSFNDSVFQLQEVVVMNTDLRSRRLPLSIKIIHHFFRSELLQNIVYPNILYKYNFYNSSNQGYFWFDLVTNAGLHLLPPHPTRYGYIFTGWYLEPEATTHWNNQLPISTEETLILFANWQQI